MRTQTCTEGQPCKDTGRRQYLHVKDRGLMKNLPWAPFGSWTPSLSPDWISDSHQNMKNDPPPNNRPSGINTCVLLFCPPQQDRHQEMEGLRIIYQRRLPSSNDIMVETALSPPKCDSFFSIFESFRFGTLKAQQHFLN